MLLRRDARKCARSIHKGQQGEPVPLGKLHDTNALAIPLRKRHPEVSSRPLVNVAAFLVTDERNALRPKFPDTAHQSRIIGQMTIAVELDEVIEQTLNVVKRVRTILMPR